MNRIRKIAEELLEKYPDKFTNNFEENKRILNDMAEVKSKFLRNKIAGYITRMVIRSKVAEKVEQ
ncbi:MAG: 30S ribosomal protein S17e [Nitrososphaeria archaeon]|nr:30S ribosomal protein S17e [Conexivisphaerales archaeon]